MKQPPNPKIFMMMSLGMVVAGGIAGFFGYSGMTAKADEVHRLKSEVKDARTVQKELDDSKAQLQETSEKLKHLEASVPDFAYVPTLLTELERVGKENGIEVLGVRPVPKPPEAKKPDDGEVSTSTVKQSKPYEELNIEIKGRGTYGDTMRFVQALQTFQKIVAARSVSLSPKTEIGQTAKILDVSIELRAYIFKPKDVKPDAPKSTAQLEVNHHEG